jgi:hypothetical protein
VSGVRYSSPGSRLPNSASRLPEEDASRNIQYPHATGDSATYQRRNSRNYIKRASIVTKSLANLYKRQNGDDSLPAIQQIHDDTALCDGNGTFPKNVFYSLFQGIHASYEQRDRSPSPKTKLRNVRPSYMNERKPRLRMHPRRLTPSSEDRAPVSEPSIQAVMHTPAAFS